MSDERWKALVVDQHDGAVEAAVRELSDDALPEGDVVVRVAYSSLNYKDGLAMLGRNKIVRNYPMVPGVDLAGTVEQSASPAYGPGDQVVLTAERREWPYWDRHWTKQLTLRDWATLQSALNKARFWHRTDWKVKWVMLDGFYWTIEGLRGRRLHAAHGSRPEDGPVFELGRLFHRLAGNQAGRA